MSKKKKSVREIALQDISEEFLLYENMGGGDRFDVSIRELSTHEVAELNKELGIHKVNKKDSAKNFGR